MLMNYFFGKDENGEKETKPKTISKGSIFYCTVSKGSRK